MGKKTEGAEGEKPSQPNQNCTNFLHTWNSKFKREEIQTMSASFPKRTREGLGDPIPWPGGGRREHSPVCKPSSGSGGNQNKAISRFLVAIVKRKRFSPVIVKRSKVKKKKKGNIMKRATPRCKQEPYVDLSWEICKYRLELIRSTCC